MAGWPTGYDGAPVYLALNCDSTATLGPKGPFRSSFLDVDASAASPELPRAVELPGNHRGVSTEQMDRAVMESCRSTEGTQQFDLSAGIWVHWHSGADYSGGPHAVRLIRKHRIARLDQTAV